MYYEIAVSVKLNTGLNDISHYFIFDSCILFAHTISSDVYLLRSESDDSTIERSPLLRALKSWKGQRALLKV